jgi:hypothetical protein
LTWSLVNMLGPGASATPSANPVPVARAYQPS